MLSDSSESEDVPGDAEAAVAAGASSVKEEGEEEPEHFTSSSWRKRPLPDKVKKEFEAEGEPWVPVRVTEALKGAKDFADFKKRRKFIYLHLFSGEDDVLGQAILRLAKLDGLEVEVRAFDRLPGQYQVDLAADQPFNDILDAARGGLVDGSHCGYPCGSFSMARYNEGHGPPPVRSLEFIYGLPTNDVRQQAEADKGTMLALRSIQVTSEVIQTQRLRRVPECGTMENPPGSDGQKEGPSWRLPEMEDFLTDFKCEVVMFNT